MRHWFALVAAIGLLATGQTPPPTSEVETFLYMQDAHDPKFKDAIYVLWIPQPMLKYCVNRPYRECINIDFCLRTTSRQVKMCQNLPVDVSRIPRYSPETLPRRVSGMTYFRMVDIKGWDALLNYFKSQPPGTFDRLTPATRFKAKVRLTRKPDDDDFTVLEILAPPPS